MDLITACSIPEHSREEVLGEAVAVDIWEPYLERLCELKYDGETEDDDDFDRALWSGKDVIISLPDPE